MIRRSIQYLGIVFIVVMIVAGVSFGYGRYVLGQDHRFIYGKEELYSSFEDEKSLSIDQMVDQSDLIVKIQPTMHREKYEKNVVLQVEVLEVYRGNISKGEIIRLAEPTYSSTTFYNHYIPLNDQKTYIVFLQSCNAFSFPVFCFTDPGYSHVVQGEAKFKEPCEETLRIMDLMKEYDYFMNAKDSYIGLNDWLNQHFLQE